MRVNVGGQTRFSHSIQRNYPGALQAECKTQQKNSRGNLIKKNHRKSLQRITASFDGLSHGRYAPVRRAKP
jgi:hypothetical protein